MCSVEFVKNCSFNWIGRLSLLRVYIAIQKYTYRLSSWTSISLEVGGSFRSSLSLFSSGSTKTSLATSTGVRTGVGKVRARKFGTEIGSLVMPEPPVALLQLFTSTFLYVVSGGFCLLRASVFALRDFTMPVDGSTTSESTCWNG